MKYVAPQMKVIDVDLLNSEILAAACSGYCKKKFSCNEYCANGHSTTT